MWDVKIVCDECKVLVDKFDSEYFTCEGYCASIGRTCTGAWDEAGDSCDVGFLMECITRLKSSDAICECGEAGVAPASPPPPPSPCDEQSWPDLDHGTVCGPCKVLVDNFDSKYFTCEGYCASIGRTCTGAWEEYGDSCLVGHSMQCDTQLLSSDVICECGEAGVPASPL